MIDVIDLTEPEQLLEAFAPVVAQPIVTTCAHVSIRLFGGGRCVLCDGPGDVEDEHDQLEQLRADEEAAAEELAALDADAARLDLAEFVKQGWHVLEAVPLEWNWHHDALCKNVQGMLEEWLKRRDDPTWVMRWQNLVLNICPSSLKSRIIMVFAVAWMWLRCPTWSVLCVSLNPANVVRDSEDCHDLITSKWYRETFAVTWEVRDDIDSKQKYRTTAGGERISRGLVASFTGIHVDCILLDDPDDAHDVFSEAERRKRAGKYASISNRVKDERWCVRIVTQQRVHVDDCTGDLLTRGGYLHANYPVEYSDTLRSDTPFYTDPRREPGENLHAVRFTAAILASKRIDLGTQGFEAQYNGNPAPREGGDFKREWFRFFRIAGVASGPCKRPTGCTGVDAEILEINAKGNLEVDCMSITVDATFGSTTDAASRVGLLVVANKGPKRFVLCDRTKAMTFVQTCAAIEQLLHDYPQVTRVIVEKKANGAAIIELLSVKFSGLIPVEPEGGKESRAAAMSPAVESGCLYLLEGAPWLDEFVAELCVFPHGKHDDRVDALSQLMTYFRESLAAAQVVKLNNAWRALRTGLRPGVG